MSSQDIGTTWAKIAPDGLISETAVPKRAEDLEKLASDWIDKNVRYFDLFEWDGMKEKFWREKAFNEAGMYMLNALKFEDDDHTPELKELLRKRVSDERFAHLTLRNEENIHHFAYPTLYVDAINTEDVEATAALKQVAERGEFWSSERVPYRLLEFCYLSRVIGTEYDHDEENIIKQSVLNHQPNIVRSTYNDAYCLTHDLLFYDDSVFYNNYLGSGDYNSLETPVPYDLTELLPGLILRYIAEDNCDLALECLLIGILQTQISREMVQLVLSWVLEKSQPVGYVPGPDKDALNALLSSQWMGNEVDAPWEYAHECENEAIWAKNYHTNVVAGMTARVVKRNWDELDNRPMDSSLEEQRFRRDVTRLGQLLESLAEYDLAKGSRQMIELTESPVVTEFSCAFQEAVTFLRNQRTQDGDFGFWTEEEILYMNNGNSRKSFHNEMVSPITEACQSALDAVETCDAVNWPRNTADE